MIDWDFISKVCTILLIPFVGAMFGWLENKNKKRSMVRDMFNEIIFDAFDAIGGLALTTALHAMGKVPENDLEKSEVEYRTFRGKVKDFKKKQALTTI